MSARWHRKGAVTDENPFTREHRQAQQHENVYQKLEPGEWQKAEDATPSDGTTVKDHVSRSPLSNENEQSWYQSKGKMWYNMKYRN